MIDVKDLVIKYGDFTAVKGVDFFVEEGTFFTLLGPSGCGKTTTLEAIAGFLSPASGQISINGKDVTKVPVEKREIGMVFQSYALFPTMTVFDNIAYGLKIKKMSKQDIEKRVHELANLVDLNEEQLHKNVSALSGGQQQRVAIARALAKEPDVVLFDEPLSNLDAKLRKELRKELKNIQQRTGMTAIYVTHDQEEALEMSNKIAVFNNGNIEQIGTPQEIYDQSATEFVCTFIGDANKIGPQTIEHINSNSVNKFAKERVQYIREEKITLESKKDSAIKCPSIVERIDFQGKSISLVCSFLDTSFKLFARNSADLDYQPGDSIDLYIHPENILEYEVN